MPGLANVPNVHPLFVHFPIALTLVALLFEMLHIVMRRDSFRTMATALLYLSAVAAIATAITGDAAADILGHDTPGHDLVHTHRDIMVGFTILISVTAMINLLLSTKPLARLIPIWNKWIRPIVLIAAAILLVIGTDRGGQLVFRYGMGVKMESPVMEEHDHSTHQHELPSEQKEDKTREHDDEHEHVH